MPIMITESLGSDFGSTIMAGDFAVGGWLLSGGDGDFYRQYHGAEPENAGHRLAVSGCQRSRLA